MLIFVSFFLSPSPFSAIFAFFSPISIVSMPPLSSPPLADAIASRRRRFLSGLIFAASAAIFLRHFAIFFDFRFHFAFRLPGLSSFILIFASIFDWLFIIRHFAAIDALSPMLFFAIFATRFLSFFRYAFADFRFLRFSFTLHFHLPPLSFS
jgi:hypothetical protein